MMQCEQETQLYWMSSQMIDACAPSCAKQCCRTDASYFATLTRSRERAPVARVAFFSEQRQNPYGDSSFTELVALRRKKYEIDFRAVPHQFAANFVAFKQRLRLPFRCTLCGEAFTAAQSGTLLCSFHPLEHFAKGERSTPYYSIRPSPCETCNELHLAPELRHVTDYDTRLGDDGITTTTFAAKTTLIDYSTDAIPLKIESIHQSIGCVAIDHCTTVAELFAKPYVALPLVYFGHLVASQKIDVNEPPADSEHKNWLLVDKAEQLTKMLAIAVPYVQIPFLAPIQVIYEEMALKFGIESLEEGARAARVWNNKSSLSQLQYLHHPLAEHKDKLHKMDLQHVKFAPFIIIARVSQNFYLSEGMRLIDVK